MITEHCTEEECEAQPECTTCGKRKKLVGRDYTFDEPRCDYECPGYRLDPKPGHLWPGELKRARAESEVE